MVLAVWVRCFKLEWCRNHPKIWSGGWFVNILEGENMRDNFLLVHDLFMANYSNWLRWPPIDLRRGVHLKHQKLIFIILKNLKTFKSCSGALDGHLGADRWGVIEANLNSSFKNVIYKQTNVPVQIVAPQNVKHRSPDHILGCFLHHSNLKNLAQTARTIRIAWKHQK